MSIESQEDLIALSRVGRVVGRALKAMREALRPGMTTAELDAVGAKVLESAGARSAPRHVYGFPGVNLISVNDEVVHGIPRDRVIEPGDLVSIDVTAELDGYFADAAVTVPLAPSSPVTRKLTLCAKQAFGRAAHAARAGRPVSAIGRAVEAEVRRHGFTVIRELCGHGTGRSIHEEPQVANHAVPGDDRPLTEGLVITVEPIISAGNGRVTECADGWTVRTADGSLSAHHEHTLVITRGRPLLLTAG